MSSQFQPYLWCCNLFLHRLNYNSSRTSLLLNGSSFFCMTKPDFWKKKFIKQVQKNEFIEVTWEFCPFFGIWGCEQDCTNQEKHFHHLFQGFRPELLMPQQGWSSSPFCLWTWEPKLSQENCVSSAGICSITSLEIQRHKWINNSCFLVFFIRMPGIWCCFSRSVLRKRFRGIFVNLSTSQQQSPL